jgi:phosphatidylserine/phosphatidylglycerophosphate/cardiolipin synthase-like enzyme
MKRYLFLALSLVALTPSVAFSQEIAGYPDFELVESVPIGTTLDNPDIRNAHEVWLEMINGATKSLDIEEFYISNKPGEPLEDVIEAIEAAAKRGVAVRLIADARMQKTYPQTIERLAGEKNVSARIIDFGKLAGGVQHAKFFIVDDKEVFFGSQNFDWRALEHIHELGFRIKQADAVRFYRDIFALDWNLAATNDKSALAKSLTFKKYPFPLTIVEADKDTILFTPTASPLGVITDTTAWDEPNIVRLIDGSKNDVCLQFLNYGTQERGGSAYTVLDDAIRRAAARGVKVRLIVSDWEKGTASEKALVDLSQVPNIEVKFSVIPEWSGGYVSFARVEHCKFIVVDSSSFWLGTSNAEKSYFYNTRNLGVVARNKRLASLLHRVFMKSWEGPYIEIVKPGMTYQTRNHGGE